MQNLVGCYAANSVVCCCFVVLLCYHFALIYVVRSVSQIFVPFSDTARSVRNGRSLSKFAKPFFLSRL